MRHFLFHLLILIIATLTGCGGGGGGGGGTSGTSWSAEAYLKAPNSETLDYFGNSVAIDGDTIVVGAVGEDSNQTTITNGTTASTNNSSTAAGAVYVFRRNGTTWAQEAYLKAPYPDMNDEFGNSVSISGDTIAVGAFKEDSNQITITNGTTASSDNTRIDSGAIYVYKRSGTTWTQEAFLKAPNAEADDQLGYSVAISGDTIVAGALAEDSNLTTITNGSTITDNNLANYSGAAYVFKRSGTTWAVEAYLKAPNAEANDNFGNSIAISGDTIVVGATGEDSNQTTITNATTVTDNNSASTSGAAYVFKRSGSTWSHEAYLKAPNAETNDYFGHRVAISGDTIVVAANVEDSSQTTITNGTTVADNNSALASGAAYVFKRSGTTWTHEAYLKAPNGEAGDQLGTSVAISGDTIVVGAYFEDSNQTTITNGTTPNTDNSSTDSGAAYIFRRSGTTWANEAYLKAPNAEAGDHFGISVAISGNTIVVGADAEDSNQTTITNGTGASTNNSATDAGASYVFKRQ